MAKKYRIKKEFKQNLYLGKYMIIDKTDHVVRHANTLKEANECIKKHS